MPRTREVIITDIHKAETLRDGFLVEIGRLNGERQRNPNDYTIQGKINNKDHEYQQTLLQIKSLEKELADLDN